MNLELTDAEAPPHHLLKHAIADGPVVANE
jgi:hypothetical protein